MAITREALPYGLRDVKIATINISTGLPGTLVDLPNAQTFNFTDTEDFEELRGDDRVVAKRGKGPMVDWELESGGISLEAYAIMSGGAVTLGGTSPAAWKKYKKLATDSRPDFWVQGKCESESGGDFHCMLPRVKADDSLEGSMEDGSFWITKASGTGLPSFAVDVQLVDLVYQFTQNETSVAIPVFVPTP